MPAHPSEGTKSRPQKVHGSLANKSLLAEALIRSRQTLNNVTNNWARGAAFTPGATTADVSAAIDQAIQTKIIPGS